MHHGIIFHILHPSRLMHQAEALDQAALRSSEAAKQLLSQAEEVLSKALATDEKAQDLDRWYDSVIRAILYACVHAFISRIAHNVFNMCSYNHVSGVVGDLRLKRSAWSHRTCEDSRPSCEPGPQPLRRMPAGTKRRLLPPGGQQASSPRTSPRDRGNAQAWEARASADPDLDLI